MKTPAEKTQRFDETAPVRRAWMKRNAFYHAYLQRLVGFLVPAGARVLEIGCGAGELLASLRPSQGLGIDLSPRMIEEARALFPAERHPELRFEVGDAEALQVSGPFDYIVLSDLIGELDDVWTAFRELQRVASEDTRVVVLYRNALWEPALKLAESLGLKMPQAYQNWLALGDIENLLGLAGFEVIQTGNKLLFPFALPGVSWLFNTLLANLPLVSRLGLVSYAVAQLRPAEPLPARGLSVTVVIPCRNERGNIRAAVERTPEMGCHTELLFVDGNSNDGTVEEIERVMAEYAGRRTIRLLHQTERGGADGAGHGKMLKLGKGDAVRKGFTAATGEVLMILDADLTVPPEELPRFYLALAERRGSFINGTRMVYPMERDAMRTLNKAANRAFALIFTWLLGQRLKDTLCGTKVLLRKDYDRIAANRAFFGDFDPFGDFDLLFGASKQNLKIVEMPVHYAERTYGDIKIRRFRHGLILLRMCWFAMRRVRFF